MREIKFRAWDNEKKEWCINIGVGNILYEIHANKHHDLNDTFILNQFTGLKDKNGKEIYEGDIVKIIQCECIGQSADGSEEEWIPCEGEVLFEDAMFVFEGHSAGSLPLYAYKDDLEVIGNMFVTPK